MVEKDAKKTVSKLLDNVKKESDKLLDDFKKDLQNYSNQISKSRSKT